MLSLIVWPFDDTFYETGPIIIVVFVRKDSSGVTGAANSILTRHISIDRHTFPHTTSHHITNTIQTCMFVTAASKLISTFIGSGWKYELASLKCFCRLLAYDCIITVCRGTDTIEI